MEHFNSDTTDSLFKVRWGLEWSYTERVGSIEEGIGHSLRVGSGKDYWTIDYKDILSIEVLNKQDSSDGFLSGVDSIKCD